MKNEYVEKINKDELFIFINIIFERVLTGCSMMCFVRCVPREI